MTCTKNAKKTLYKKVIKLKSASTKKYIYNKYTNSKVYYSLKSGPALKVLEPKENIIYSK